jgi:hypothetical protein
MKKSTLIIIAMVAIVSAMVSSCKKTPAPTAEISAAVDGYTVDFTATVTDADSYAWDFGDGETSTELNPSHTYTVSGNYNVNLVVKGEGGEVTALKEVVIAASFLEMLTGGTAAANGKTWVLSTAYTEGMDGSGPVSINMPITIPYADNVLDGTNGLESEYDNEYTFFANGNYSVNTVNGYALASAIYGTVLGIIPDGTGPSDDLGMCIASSANVTGATWTLHNTDLIVDAITDQYTTDIPPEHGDVTFTGETWISLSSGAFFGILDFPTTAMFIIKEITPAHMNVVLFLCGYGYGDNQDDMMLPTDLIHMTFVPKTSK